MRKSAVRIGAHSTKFKLDKILLDYTEILNKDPKPTYPINFINILRAAFAPVFSYQKNYKAKL